MQLKLERKDDSRQGALMHVSVAGAQARLIVLPTDPASTQAAMDFMARVDPPSQGVPMRQASPVTVNAYFLLVQLQTANPGFYRPAFHGQTG